ncbi:hypothetical protein V5O48_003061 [Marasmius crinis-equi]|uniref:SET domain-containing protein n=1 Tax=Marasmius crinis-equi TaxID=585013 RepID=A0ABR3FUG7_9AGAR
MSTRKRKANETRSTQSVKSGVSEATHPKRTKSSSWPGLVVIAFALATVAGAIYYAWSDAKNSENESNFDSVEERDASIFYVQDIPGKGKGVIAARDIQPGELIIHEDPLFIVPPKISVSPSALIHSNLQRVDPKAREAFFNLSYVNLPAHVDPEEDEAEVALAIFQTNAVAAGDGVGIFPRMARLNHGCSSAFNVVYTWREKEGALVVHALKGITKGQELLTTYATMRKPRDFRRAFLRERYGFECQCDVCSLPEELSKGSDERLVAISDLYSRFATWGQELIDGMEAIDVVKKIWALGDEEGYLSERGQLAADAAWVAAAHSDAAATREWAKVALRWYSYELGSDSEQSEHMSMIMENPRLHRSWGTRGVLSVGRPDGS